MKLIVSGSRDLNQEHHFKWVYRILTEIHKTTPIDLIVSGVALEWLWDESPLIGGPDRYAVIWAKINNVPYKPFRPDWSKGKGAGKNRNVDMARFGDACVVFWNGKSTGTEHMIKFMKMIDKPVRIELETIETSLFDE